MENEFPCLEPKLLRFFGFQFPLPKVRKMITTIKTFRLPALLLIAGLILLIGGGSAFAAIYNIDTDDNSVAEWSAQGIPVFQTDATGDTINGGTANDDIVQAWVATGNGGNTLYFLMELNASPALNQDNNRTAVASIDCDNDGVDEEPEDRLISYFPGTDALYIVTGDQNYYTPGNAVQGQRVNQYIEWSVDLAQLPPDSQTPGVDCRNQVGIRFGTGDNSTFPATVLDETQPLRGWNIPTTVNIKELQARRHISLAATLFIALMGMLLIGASAFAFQRIRSR